MTRKQAISRVLELLSGMQETEELAEIQAVLTDLLEDLPVTGWTDNAIFDAIDQFFLDHGRYPNAREMDLKGLPPHSVIKSRYGMTAREFLSRYFPERAQYYQKHRVAYAEKSVAYWTRVFRAQVKKHEPHSAVQYNYRRDEGTPGWHYIAKLNGVESWNDLLTITKTKLPPRRRTPEHITVHRLRREVKLHELRAIREEMQEKYDEIMENHA